MNSKIADRRWCLRLVSFIILIVGFGAAVYIYQTAAKDSTGVLGYEIVDGKAYPILSEDSKTYRHDLELYGGKAAVLADEFSRWFVGLWHGKSLAYIVVCITVVISFWVFLAGNRARPSKSDAVTSFDLKPTGKQIGSNKKKK